MFQKELGKDYLQISLKNYGRLSILTNLRLKVLKNFMFPQIVFFQSQM